MEFNLVMVLLALPKGLEAPQPKMNSKSTFHPDVHLDVQFIMAIVLGLSLNLSCPRQRLGGHFLDLGSTISNH